MLEVLFEPFTEIALDTVGIWYLGTVVVMMALAFGLNRAGFESDSPFPDHWSLWQKLGTAAVLAPIIEESIFRIAPTYFFGGLTVVLAASIVWAVLHGDTMLVVAVSIPIYVKLALGGFFLEAILLHMLHNTWATLLTHFGDQFSDTGEDGGDEYDWSGAEEGEITVDDVLDRLENDPDFEPTVQINGTTYDSLGDVPSDELDDLYDE